MAALDRRVGAGVDMSLELVAKREDEAVFIGAGYSGVIAVECFMLDSFLIVHDGGAPCCLVVVGAGGRKDTLFAQVSLILLRSLTSTLGIFVVMMEGWRLMN